MTAAAPHVSETLEVTEPLAWDEICRRYPDEYVCLVEMVFAQPWDAQVATARVAGHSPTRREATAPLRACPTYRECGIRFTTERNPEPLREPFTFTITDERHRTDPQ